MSDIRGEKVRFGRDDIVSLHALPSAQAHEPVILHCTDRPSHFSVLTRLVACLAGITALVVLLVVATVESGLVDSTLNTRALAALNRAVGPSYTAEVEKTVIRFSSFGGLALRAENVSFDRKEDGENVANASAVGIVLDPLALLTGRVAPSRLDIDGAMFNPAMLPKGPPIDFSTLRLDAVPSYQETAFAALERFRTMVSGSGLSRVRVTNLSLPITGAEGRPMTLAVERLTFARDRGGDLSIEGRYQLDGKEGQIDLIASGTGPKGEIRGEISGIPTGGFTLQHAAEGEIRTGVDAQATVSLSAARGGEGSKPRLDLAVSTEGGTLYLGGGAADIEPSRIVAYYDYDRRAVEIGKSEVHVGASSFPFTGGLIDLDRLPGQAGPGFGIDVLVEDAVSAPIDTGATPVRFEAKASGRLLPQTKQVLFDELGVSTPRGSLAGSLGITFGGQKPAVNFAMVGDTLDATAVKQMWPYWLGRRARQWVIANIYGGTVTNGRIEVSMAADRPADPDGRLQLREGELTITFDITNTRLNIAGDIPPLRDAAGHFELHGQHLDIALTGGTAFMGSGRSVAVTGGTFRLPDTYERPLMAEMDLDISGAGDAIAELITYRPIDVLKKTPFTPGDFSGPVKANVRARFGLVRDQSPPPPQWTADIDLLGVDLKTPIAGRTITEVEGNLVVNPVRADLNAKARIDGVPLDVALVEPVSQTAGLKRDLTVTGTISEKDRTRLFPGVADLIAGPVGIAVSTEPDGSHRVETDLGRSLVQLPWIGWEKGAGVPAKATFALGTPVDGVTRLSDFDFSGDGFTIAGDVSLKDGGLSAARFDKVRLSAQDSYALNLERTRSGYAVKVQGDMADVRPVLARLKSSPGGAGGGGTGGVSVSVRADIGRVVGFNGEALRSFKLAYAHDGTRLSGLDLTGVTGSGQAVVAKLSKGGAEQTLEVTTGDAGALARLSNLYRHMGGGLLNMKLRGGADGAWRGPVDIRQFRLEGEEKLRSIVSTPAGGKSLNEAVRSEIDTSSMRFERGFAFVVSKDGTLRVENGVVRGDAVGATFQGMVRNASGQMEMTGTFMPAYGLNRLFAELPLIGFILGNGSDRGLIGITFKLTGPFDQPRLMINPLSVIAPGVFRNIFEF
ncbi:DUF3971 domain-containing protein [Rhizobium sp. TRM96647]|uniref:DUF3971 domain-containing protein n=1 Tax=unclassified Rhizobium TaxID=2613769 RepID=UPI0021E717B1|nr:MULTISPECIES: DUF3971 domain-containing protein [unclassified Rhizobium]MCV3737453.1 DUF3971 domain-containing protein [Rhizobium sp. TRM96647]MCV3756457.1 DUF3971 domain-containing protein [Rhizobium sp. TRM96650]